ncbi:MAG TPA: SpoIIE family protein phosphatase [Treponemataceae bacterium]|nr:SpoIIE family protein phosphatase [Spirochaetaceae bacterium]HOE07996.1 SpoIIE family protein phosphatase [Treponemataceae bacterium]HQL04264.1 SpoIIE family protein phosphatase [Treponemataceae bacterium]
MYKSRRRFIIFGVNVFSGLFFVVLSMMLLGEGSFLSSLIVGAIVFCVFQIASSLLTSSRVAKAERRALNSKETGLLSDFIKKLRFSYSVDDFIESIQTVLEDKADCSVLYVDRENNYVIYNSPDRLTCSDETMRVLELNFSARWPEGFYFMDKELGIVSDLRETRGFFLVHGTKHFYVFCRYTKLFDPIIYPRLFNEFTRFEERSKTITSLSEIAELSKEWTMLAETQRSFLPQKMPDIPKLDVAAYFRPLVNVSGDYYSVLPMNDHKTLVMLGDVSGKGLAAALVMGLVMNVVKIIENKEDLAGTVRAIDRAIKGMRLQDKYTVLFIGIIDTEKMNIRYINASMSDPLVVTQTPAGYKIKPLSSNCSLIGIIDIDDIEVAEQKLYRGDLILMASDGVSEVMDDDGVELGNTELYMNTIQNSALKSAQKFIDDIADLVMSYNGNKKLRDDVTMLVAKIER